MTDPTFTITITADTICAWCYVNHVRLHKAIHLYKKTYCSRDTFSIHYKPFILQPHLSTTSVPVQDKFLERFGPTRASTIERLMDRTVLGDGIKFSKNGKVGDSRASHQVIAMLGREGDKDAQDRVVGEIMKRYYEQDGDITDQEMLIDCAVNIGYVDRSIVVEALNSEELRSSIDEEALAARTAGTNGVPYTVINGVVIEGARDVEEFLTLLIDVKQSASVAQTDNPRGLGACIQTDHGANNCC